MKILAVTPYYWPAFSYGGPVFSLHYLNKALVKKGIAVTVYTTNAGLKNKVATGQEVEVDGVLVTYFRYSKILELITDSELNLSLTMGSALKRNLQHFDIVYIATAWSYSTVAAADYCRLYKKPYIIAPRGMLYPEVFYRKAWKKWPFYRLAVKKALDGVSRIHYTSQDEAEKTHSFLRLKNKDVIIPNGIELSEFNALDRERLKVKYPHLKNKKVILFLGRINWKKGLGILLGAFARLAKENDDMHLLIAGPGEQRDTKKVKKWIDKYGLGYGKVTFTGILNGKEKLEAYSGSDIFVLPSYSENFGMSVVEAMACSVPVVISNKVGIYKDVEQNNAGIVTETNPHSLYAGIKLLLENPDLSKKVAMNGRKLVESYYEIDKVADRIISVFQDILQ